MLDVHIEPKVLPEATYLFGTERFQEELKALMPKAVSAARRDWERGSTYKGMLVILREIREKNKNCLGFDNYTQLPLAFIFLAARAGNVNEAESLLDDYLERRQVDEDEAAKLRRVLREDATPS